MKRNEYCIAVQKEYGFFTEKFNTIDEAVNFHLKDDAKYDSSHYELIEGPQCLYFDFDGDVDVKHIFQAIMTELTKFNKIVILAYSSNNDIKKSYHIVVKGIHFKSHIECGFMAKKIVENNNIKNFDDSIYTSKRFFRLLGSRKLHDTRVKVFHSYYSNDNDFKYPLTLDEQIKLSLIINIPEYSIQMDENTFKKPFIFKQTEYKNLTDNEIQKIRNLIEDKYPSVFTLRRVERQTVFFNRIKKSHCHVCDRIHENENVFMTKVGESYFFRCLRSTESVLFENTDKTVKIVIKKNELHDNPTEFKKIFDHNKNSTREEIRLKNKTLFGCFF